MKKKKLGLTAWILISLVLGLATGLIFNALPSSVWKDEWLVGGLFHVLGTMFIAALKMLIVPVVFFSLVVGVSSLTDAKQLGRIGGKTILFYLVTTAIAITMALGISLMINPGKNVDLSAVTEGEVTVNEPQPFTQTLIDIVPDNPIMAMAEGNMLQIIFFAVLFGYTLTLLRDSIPTVVSFVNELNTIFLRMVTLIMYVAPIGVFALIAKSFAVIGFGLIVPVLKYMLAVLIGLAIQLVVYALLIRFVGKLDPFVFFKKVVSPLSVGFSTSSSAAALPIYLRTAEEKLGVDKKVASFTLPLGSTINMDGTAIMQGAATIFIAQVYMIDLSIEQLLLVIITAVIASIGTASMPGAGVIMLSLILTSIGLPLEGIALVIGVDRIVDMFRTVINITGDGAATVIVANSEKALDQDVYYDKHA